ncbi:MAG: ATP-binding protein, partial [Clostridium sp.]
MGVKDLVRRIGESAGDKVAKLATLSPEQVEDVQLQRINYLFEKPDPNDTNSKECTERLIAASSVEIFNAYLPQIKDLYLPVNRDAEYGEAFDVNHNIRYFNITKWVTDKKENSIEKLINVYAVLCNEDCNIALVFNRNQKNTNVYLAVVNTKNKDNNIDIEIYKDRLIEAVKGNFPGAEWGDEGAGILPCLNNDKGYSVASASNIPTEKSEKFISQTIEKLLDGIVPDTKKKEYTIVLLATPISDVDDRKLKLGEFYSGMAPYSAWQTNYTFSENNAIGSGATAGLNIGASAGIQNGQNLGTSESASVTDSESTTNTESHNETKTKGSTKNGGFAFILNGGYSRNKSTSNTFGTALSNSLSKAVTNGVCKTVGTMKSINLGGNFGANFARSSTVTATIGKNEGITQSFTNFNIKHALELLENQMKRLEQSTALGMWDFAAYVLSEDQNVANNVAHTYLALTLGEESYMAKSSINLW